MRVKLEELHAAVPEKISYNPKGFPGARYNLTIKDVCTCRGKEKCGCEATCVVFDSGAIIIAGPKTTEEGNATFYRICQQLPEFEDENVAVPKDERWRTRIAKFVEYLALNANNKKAPRKKKNNKKSNALDKLNELNELDDLDDSFDQEELDIEEAEENEMFLDIINLEAILENDDDEFKEPTNPIHNSNDSIRDSNDQIRDSNDNPINDPMDESEDEEVGDGVTDLMKVCEQGRLDIVKLFLDSGMGGDIDARDASGHTALDRLRALPNADTFKHITQYLIAWKRK